MERDIRLLTLYKQHYMDSYTEKMESTYSAWGYYDGFDIQELNEIQIPNMISSKNMLTMSKLWYGTAKKVMELKGGYSNQNIGLFRCATEDDEWNQGERFWKTNPKLPFFTVAFLQLRDRTIFSDVAKNIEKVCNIGTEIAKEAVCMALTYGTFDNADIVLLLQGNSITKIIEVIEMVERMEEICYVHSIMSVAEAYLKECSLNKDYAELWKGTRCFIEEPIDLITIQFVLSGNSNSLNYIKHMLDELHHKWGIKGFEKAKYSFMTGHESLAIHIRDTDVRSLIGFMLPKGFATHQNNLYGHCIYNIQTNFVVKQMDLENINSIRLPENTRKKTRNWCRSLIDKCREYEKISIREKDESLYSYFQAMIQTLNTLDQYEQFEMSRDIYYLLSPAFNMFEWQFEEAILETREGYFEKIENIKEAMCSFINSVNSVIYHTIHTDQIFLMVPGYSGTSFSIPIKLNLFYLWFVERLSKVLNDSDEMYSCIMTPEMESRPTTRAICFRDSEKSRLICVNLSQRALFFPKHLMIILSHEIGHYVGKQIRCRDKRKKCLVISMACYLSEGLLSYNYTISGIEPEKIILFENFRNEFKAKMEDKYCRKAFQYIKEEFYNEECYAETLIPLLVTASYEFLVNLDLEKNIEEFDAYKEIYGENDIEKLKFLYEIKYQIERRRKSLLTSGEIEEIVYNIVRLYREIFSDMIALEILQCNLEEFVDTFQISEGVGIDSKNKPQQQAVREYIVNKLMCEKNESETDGNTFPCLDFENDDLFVFKNLYEYKFLWEYLEIYAKDCYSMIKKRCEENDIKKEVEEVRKLFAMFDESSRLNCSEIYTIINEKIALYAKSIENKIV